MDPTTPLLDELRELLHDRKLGLEQAPAPDGPQRWVVTYEGARHPLAELPLDALDPAARRAELVAVAAGLEAAVKLPYTVVPQEPFRAGAANLLAKVERARYAQAYDAVVMGRGGADAERLAHRALGVDLIAVYVRDESYRFRPFTRGQLAVWGVSPGTVHAGARSNLYHYTGYTDVKPAAQKIAVGDGYDAARALCVADLFYHRDRGQGVPVALPGRDLLLVGEEAAAGAARAHAEQDYPLCPYPLVFQGDALRRV